METRGKLGTRLALYIAACSHIKYKPQGHRAIITGHANYYTPTQTTTECYQLDSINIQGHRAIITAHANYYTPTQTTLNITSYSINIQRGQHAYFLQQQSYNKLPSTRVFQKQHHRAYPNTNT